MSILIWAEDFPFHFFFCIYIGDEITKTETGSKYKSINYKYNYYYLFEIICDFPLLYFVCS